jgi:hypothetical protein
VSPHTFPGRPPAGLPPYPTHGAVKGPPGWRSLGMPSPGVSAEATCRADLGLVPFEGENAPVRVVVTRIEQDGTMQHRLVELVRRAKGQSRLLLSWTIGRSPCPFSRSRSVSQADSARFRARSRARRSKGRRR